MSDDKFVLLQKQVKDNSEDLQSMFLDMKSWEAEMKRKDRELSNLHNNQANITNLPPVRSKKKKITQEPKVTKQGKNSSTNKKSIKSCDYTAWDKFDVEKACKELDNEDSSEASEEELTAEALERKHEEATKVKDKGNKFVQEKKWDSAIACYSEAMKIFPVDAVFYANRAFCHFKKDNLCAAEADCTTAIDLDAKYVKAYHRRATVRMELKNYKEAQQDVQAILQLEPSNKEAKAMLALINKKLEAAKPIIITSNKATKEISLEKKMGEKICNLNNKKNKKMNNKKGNEVEKKIKKEETKSEVKYMPIPDWLPEKDNVAIVDPIIKPPHLHSKEPMKPIKVQDVKFQITKCEKKDSQMSNTKGIQQPKPSNTINKKVIEEKSALSQPLEVEELPIVLPKAPRTAVQFLLDWRGHKSSKYRYQYLKQLPINSLPSIFQDSMEVDIFSEILHTLKNEFIPQKDPVYQYLKDLSKIKRFRALIMFISNSEKEGIKLLLEYCKNVENKTEEEINELYGAYEL